MLKVSEEQLQAGQRNLVMKLEELAARAERYRDLTQTASGEEERQRWASLAMDLRETALTASNLVDPQ